MIITRRTLLYVCCVIVLAACGTREVPTATPSRGNTTALPPAPEWVEPSTVISVDNVSDARLLGRLDSPDMQGTIFLHVFSPDGTRLAGLSHSELLIWDIISGELAGNNTRQGADAIYFSPNKDEIYMVISDGAVLVADAAQGVIQTDFLGHAEYAGVSAFHQDAGWLALGGLNGEIKIWNPIERVSMVTIITEERNAIGALAFSNDGSLLGVIDAAGVVTLWNWETKEQQLTLSVEQAARLLFSPDGQTVAIGTNNSIELRNSVDGQLLHTLDTGNGGVTDVMLFSPDGAYIVNGGVIPNMQVWHTETGTLTTELPGIGGGPVSAAFSPDGSMLLASVMTDAVTLWDMNFIDEETPIHAKLDMGASQIFSVAWSPDGFSMLFFDSVGPVHVWGISEGG